jgi:hypothetical protein
LGLQFLLGGLERRSSADDTESNAIYLRSQLTIRILCDQFFSCTDLTFPWLVNSLASNWVLTQLIIVFNTGTKGVFLFQSYYAGTGILSSAELTVPFYT